MIKSILLSFLFLLGVVNFVNSQYTHCEWAQKGIGNDQDIPTDVTHDNDGNVITCGVFAGTSITFGNITLTNTSTYMLAHAIYLVKYDRNGNLLWAKSFGGLKDDTASKVKCDNEGNIYMTGGFQGSEINFGTTTIYNTVNVTSYLVKFDSNGNEIWVKSATGVNYSSGNLLDFDNSNNLILAGDCDGSAFIFDNIVFPINQTSIFIIKYDSTGAAIWHENINNGYTASISIDKNDNILLAGNFSGLNVIIGGNTFINLSTNNILNDLFLAKYNSTGTVLWAKSFGGGASEVISSIKTDTHNDIYITGGFRSDTLNFEQIQLVNTFSPIIINNILNSTFDFFLTKLDSLGNIIWAKQAGETIIDSYDWDFGENIVIDQSDNIIVVGRFNSTINFGSGSISSIGNSNLFLTEYNSNGTNFFTTEIGNSYLINSSIDIDSLNNIYIVACASDSSLSFGINNIQLSNNNYGGESILVKYNSSIEYINEKSNDNTSIYPNPTKGTITYVSENESQLIITNSLGEEILNEILHSGDNLIDLNSVNNGVYFLNILAKDSKSILKIVKN